MPIYEYKCLDCGRNFEKMRKVSDEPLTICENCGGKLEKQVSLSGFQFKGAGWYVTDYAGKKADAKSDNKSENKSENKTETKADIKTETKTEKSSSGESTAKPEPASKPTQNSDSSSKKD